MIKISAVTKDGKTVPSPLQTFTFPAGEAHIKAEEGLDWELYSYFVAYVTRPEPQDLFHLSALSQFISLADNKTELRLVLPYLPAARADRGTPNLRIYTSFLVNQVGADKIVTVDPHSPEWVNSYQAVAKYESAPDNVVVFPIERVIKREVQDPVSGHDDPYMGVIAPDKGAHDRALAAATVMGVPVYQAEKTRDFTTGKLTGFKMQDELPVWGKLLIVDDICDGGGTFLGLAEATGLPKERLDLWVTHGVFSKGAHVLKDHFGIVHTTNSFYTNGSWHLKDDAHDDKAAIDFEVRVHDLEPYLLAEIASNR